MSVGAEQLMCILCIYVYIVHCQLLSTAKHHRMMIMSQDSDRVMRIIVMMLGKPRQRPYCLLLIIVSASWTTVI